MGYGHSWSTQRELTQEEWEKLLVYTRTLMAHMPVHSENAGGYYRQYPLIVTSDSDTLYPPVIGPRAIRFNGCSLPEAYPEIAAKEAEQLSHDGFGLYPHGSDYCKTNGKPYDLCVCAVLMLAKSLFPDWLTIDFGGEEADRVPSLRWVCNVFPGEFPAEQIELVKIEQILAQEKQRIDFIRSHQQILLDVAVLKFGVLDLWTDFDIKTTFDVSLIRQALQHIATFADEAALRAFLRNVAPSF